MSGKKKLEREAGTKACGSDVLKKSNVFIGAIYKGTIVEEKALYLGMLKLQKGDYTIAGGGLNVEISASELKEFIGWQNYHSMYDKLLLLKETMQNFIIGIVNEKEKSFEFMALVVYCKYQRGVLTIRFNQELEKYLVDLEKKYTLIPSEVAKRLRSEKSFRLYQILKRRCFYSAQYNGEKTYKFSYTTNLSRLKIDLGFVESNAPKIRSILKKPNVTDEDCDMVMSLAPSSYKTWNDFDRYCMKKAVDEINEVSDISVSYSSVRRGRGGKVTDIEFSMTVNATQGAGADTRSDTTDAKKEEAPDAISQKQKEEFFFLAGVAISGLDIGYEELGAISEDCGYDLKKLEKAVELLKSSNNVANPVGFIRKAVKNGWEKAVPSEKNTTQKKRNGFRNFSERDNDYERIFASLLGNV